MEILLDLLYLFVSNFKVPNEEPCKLRRICCSSQHESMLKIILNFFRDLPDRQYQQGRARIRFLSVPASC